MSNILLKFYEFFWVIICLVVFYYYIKNKFIKQNLLYKLIILWPVITFVQLLIINLLLYFSWKNNQLLRHLLPPESNYLFDNFWQYDFMGYLTTIIISTLLGSALLLAAKKSPKRYLKNEEVLLVFLGCLIVSWSNIIVFIFCLFIFNLLGYLFLLVMKKLKNGDMLYPTPFILLAIIFTLLYGYKLSYLTGLY